MNTEHEHSVAAVAGTHARTPERWLLIGPSEAWCERTLSMLRQRADELTEPSFLAWRMAHGLIRVVPLAAVNAALAQALSDPQDVSIQRNAARVWVAATADDWYEATRECLALQKPSARGLSVSLLPADESDEALEAFEDFVQAADAPDTLPRLNWLMCERPLPLPPEWLCLAPLQELNETQNAALASQGLRCYEAWAEDVLASSDSDELRALWGPYPDDENLEAEDDADKVVDLNAFREERLNAEPTSANVEARFRLAAASAMPGGPDGPVHEWPLVATVSRGAELLKAFCHPPAQTQTGVPRVEFVALWNNRRKMPSKLEELCLVLTLPKRKPVLLKGEPDKDDPMQVRFQWPANRWPQDMPAQSQDAKRWLRKHLPEARVSLH